jgi:hypothetical protein
MAALPIVTRAEANRKRTAHQFVAGLGYVTHSGPPELPPGARGNKNCMPPSGTKDGSMHLLRPPSGAEPIAFVWVTAEQAWAGTNPARGNRLAWPVTHLARAGWEYVGPKRD